MTASMRSTGSPHSGADVDALGAQDFHRLGPKKYLQHHLAPDRQLVRAANGGELGSLGTLSATLHSTVALATRHSTSTHS